MLELTKESGLKKISVGDNFKIGNRVYIVTDFNFLIESSLKRLHIFSLTRFDVENELIDDIKLLDYELIELINENLKDLTFK